MSGFQILSLTVLTLLAALSVIGIMRGLVSRRVGIVWTLVWIAAGIAIAWPASTRIVARALGIGRGADLVLYCFVVVMLVGFFMIYVRLRRLESNVTLLVRHLAIRDAEADQDRDAQA